MSDDKLAVKLLGLLYEELKVKCFSHDDEEVEMEFHEDGYWQCPKCNNATEVLIPL